MALYTKGSYITSSVPIYNASGKYAHRMDTSDGVNYYVRRANNPKYRTTRKTMGPYATQALALAAAETDYGIMRPTGIAATTTTAGFTQPAVGATVVVPVTSAAGLVVGHTVSIAAAGTYQITVIAALNLTLQNLGYADAVAPTSAVTTGKAVTAVAGPG